MEKIKVKNLDLYYGDFKALKKYYDGKAVAERYEEPII